MEVKVSSPKSGLSPSDSVSDPEEKEMSDDDDRNHKHRRKETESQSLEGDALEQVLTRPSKKQNKPFENGRLYRESDFQSSESWKNYNTAPLEKDHSAKFYKSRLDLASFSRSPLDLNQRIRVNQSLSGDFGPGRGRGRESGSWNQRDSSFSSVDIASQMTQQGSVSPYLFGGRGAPNVSNTQSASWNAMGLVPGISNGGVDVMHHLGLHGMLIPPIIGLQRCRDFEERGFCLRGDMCPMEHGVNRIVIEDVQSLSQFNLPVSLPNAHILATPAGSGPLRTISVPSDSMMKSKGLNYISSKSGMVDGGLDFNGAFVASVVGGGADLYDPDQPLWTESCPETSTALLAINTCNSDETESLLYTEPSIHRHVGLCDGSDNERNAGIALGSQSTSLSVWGRIGSSKHRSEMKVKIDSTKSSSTYIGNEFKEDEQQWYNAQSAALQGKQFNVDHIGPPAMDCSLKTQNDTGRNIRKSSQKALRTLYVNGIPKKNKNRQALYSHFQKFGEVVDIYIPLNGERAFVQFSKRKEAEAALKAPDAVMGNRFIKLWWANRDHIPDDGVSSSTNFPRNDGLAVASDNLQPALSNVSFAPASFTPVPASIPACNHPKLKASNGPKAPSFQKKLESIELLKEELRKKREMLDQKRNDFRQKLVKLEKQATGLKGEAASEQAAKRQRAGAVADVSKSATLSSTDPGTVVSSPRAEVVTNNSKSTETVVPHSSESSSIVALQEPTSLKHSIRPLAPVGAPFIINRFKLDNRPTAFKIIPPLPTGLANVTVLKEHFSLYGKLPTVELEDLKFQDGNNDSNASKCSARIFFTTRCAAERAFLNGKCWEGHNLQFTWLPSTNPNKCPKVVCGSDSRSSKTPLVANIKNAEEIAAGSQKEATLKNGESEYMERRKSNAESVESWMEFSPLQP